MGTSLPDGFADLAPLVADWAHDGVVARMTRRQSSTIAELKAFYEVMLPRGEAVLAHLRQYPLGDLPPEVENLLRLMLMLAEVAPAVEWYNDPMVYDGFPIQRVQFRRTISDTAAQV